MCHITVSVAVAGDVHRHTIGGTEIQTNIGTMPDFDTENKITEMTTIAEKEDIIVQTDILTDDATSYNITEVMMITEMKETITKTDILIHDEIVINTKEDGMMKIFPPYDTQQKMTVMQTRSLAIAKRACDCCIILKSGSYTKAI